MHSSLFLNHDHQACYAIIEKKVVCLVAVCQEEKMNEKRNYSSGVVSSADLQFDTNGLLTLTYKGGQACHNNQYTRSTIIQFICSPHAGRGAPQYRYESADCTYYFRWETDIACEEEVWHN